MIAYNNERCMRSGAVSSCVSRSHRAENSETGARESRHDLIAESAYADVSTSIRDHGCGTL